MPTSSHPTCSFLTLLLLLVTPRRSRPLNLDTTTANKLQRLLLLHDTTLRRLGSLLLPLLPLGTIRRSIPERQPALRIGSLALDVVLGQLTLSALLVRGAGVILRGAFWSGGAGVGTWCGGDAGLDEVLDVDVRDEGFDGGKLGDVLLDFLGVAGCEGGD